MLFNPTASIIIKFMVQIMMYKHQIIILTMKTINTHINIWFTQKYNMNMAIDTWINYVEVKLLISSLVVFYWWWLRVLLTTKMMKSNAKTREGKKYYIHPWRGKTTLRFLTKKKPIPLLWYLYIPSLISTFNNYPPTSRIILPT